MRFLPRRGWPRALLLVAVALALVVGGYGMYLASLAGELPWQAEPTRIAVTPFADIPGFNAPSVATPAPTP